MVGTTHPATVEPQNIEQGISNIEIDFTIQNSLFDIRYSIAYYRGCTAI